MYCFQADAFTLNYVIPEVMRIFLALLAKPGLEQIYWQQWWPNDLISFPVLAIRVGLDIWLNSMINQEE